MEGRGRLVVASKSIKDPSTKDFAQVPATDELSMGRSLAERRRRRHIGEEQAAKASITQVAAIEEMITAVQMLDKCPLDPDPKEGDESEAGNATVPPASDVGPIAGLS